MVKSHTDRRLSSRFAIAACIFFVLAGQPFIPLLGVQNDEALFGYAFLQPRTGFAVQLGHSRLPLMLMSYLGTLKAWIYRPLFAVLGSGVWTLREPALLAGAASIWLFFLLLRRMAGTRAATIGCGLLAVDALYLLTSCFDWGPVALQHLLLVGGMLLLMRFYQEGGGTGALAGGFFLFGLAMWDKALAVWMLGGLGVAALAILPRQIWRAVTLRRVGIAVLAFAIGALPLIVYNARTRLETFRGQAYSTADIAGKARLLRETARGSAMLGWMVNEDWQTPKPHPAKSAMEKASAAAAALAGQPRQSLFFYAFVLALLLAPLARGGDLRAILFAAVAMAVQWIQMALVANGGGSVHHSILLWPLPQMLVAVSFAAASRRLGRFAVPTAAGALAVLMLSGGLLINQYYRAAWRNGGGQNWTDAIYQLSGFLKSAPAGRVYCMDWGMMDSLRLLNRGKLPLDLPPELDDRRVRDAAEKPDHIFVAHMPGFEFFPDTNARFVQAAGEAGFRRTQLAVISDSFGKPVYEVYRFVPAEAAR